MKKPITTFLFSSCLIALMVLSCSTPPLHDEINLEELTISEIHNAYKEGTFNSEQLVLAYQERIRQFDDPINSITFINEDAVSLAKTLDEEFKETGVLRPLHGIPIIVKDNINVTGIPTTAGSLALQNYMPSENAYVIDRLVKAGAIVLAKSNMAEWAFSPMHSESSTKGITHNPYNLDYVPAGSSGGTGAAVAANFGAAGLGTDTGNSIRGPSSHNALLGFRTTLGLISRSGIVPLFLRNDAVGPMCRSVEDATRVMEVMVGIDALDSITRYSAQKAQTNYQQFLVKDGLRNARIGVLRELMDNNTNPEILSLFNQSLEDMKSMGAIIVDSVVVPDFATLRENQWCADFRKDLESFLATYVQNDTIKTIEDIIRIGTKSAYTAERLQRQMTNKGRYEIPDEPCLDAYTDTRRIAFRNVIESKMDALQLDAIVYPSWNNQPAKIMDFEEGYKGDNSQVIAPHTGQPAFTVPMGFTTGNLPAGLQFLGRMYDEPTLIKLTYSYEQGTKHRRPPMVK